MFVSCSEVSICVIIKHVQHIGTVREESHLTAKNLRIFPTTKIFLAKFSVSPIKMSFPPHQVVISI